MKRWALVGLLSVVFLGVAGDLLARPIRVATLNLDHYTNRKPEAEKRALCEAIRSVNPDVLVLQEMGEPNDLEDLKRRLGGNWAATFLPQTANDHNAGFNLAILSRVRCQNAEEHYDLPINDINVDYLFEGKEDALDSLSFDDFEDSDSEEMRYVQRGLLTMTFEYHGRRWTVVNLHLKSHCSSGNADPQSIVQRGQEARAIEGVLREELNPETDLYVIMGDFNDELGEPTLYPFLNRPDNGEHVLSYALDQGDVRRNNWTYYWESRHQWRSYDHIFVSAQMRRHIRGGRAFIENRQGSDHCMVWCEIEVDNDNANYEEPEYFSRSSPNGSGSNLSGSKRGYSGSKYGNYGKRFRNRYR